MVVIIIIFWVINGFEEAHSVCCDELTVNIDETCNMKMMAYVFAMC